jgi:L-lactate dehydrogenase complex protein LldG
MAIEARTGSKSRMSARSDVFANIHRALGVSGQEMPRRRSVDDRLEHAPKGIIPARGQLEREGLRLLFRAEAERVAASVAEVAAVSDVPGEVADHLRRQNLPAKIRIGADPRLAALAWQAANLEVAIGSSTGQDLVCVSHAFAGVAETGTLVMVSGKDNPTTLNFLPDTHIIVLRAHEILGDYELVWEKLRMAFGKGLMPRTVNFITGPSRTRDIAQKSLLGVHGPRKLHIVIVIGED